MFLNPFNSSGPVSRSESDCADGLGDGAECAYPVILRANKAQTPAKNALRVTANPVQASFGISEGLRRIRRKLFAQNKIEENPAPLRLDGNPVT
jgi:hypothetical protein